MSYHLLIFIIAESNDVSVTSLPISYNSVNLNNNLSFLSAKSISFPYEEMNCEPNKGLLKMIVESDCSLYDDEVYMTTMNVLNNHYNKWAAFTRKEEAQEYFDSFKREK